MKKFITMFVVFTLIFTMAIPAFAAENIEVTPRSGSNSLLVSTANPTDSFTMTKSVIANSTSVKFELIKDSNYTGNGIITLRLTNTSTGTNYSLAVAANRIGVYYNTIGVTLPAGSYTVSIASAPCRIFHLSINFH